LILREQSQRTVERHQFKNVGYRSGKFGKSREHEKCVISRRERQGLSFLEGAVRRHSYRGGEVVLPDFPLVVALKQGKRKGRVKQ